MDGYTDPCTCIRCLMTSSRENVSMVDFLSCEMMMLTIEWVHQGVTGDGRAGATRRYGTISNSIPTKGIDDRPTYLPQGGDARYLR